MGVWVIGADTLAHSRFTVSPLAETVGRLLMLAGRQAPAGERGWLTTHLPAYRRRITADPFAALFVKVSFRRAWLPDFMTMPHRSVLYYRSDMGNELVGGPSATT